METDRFYYIYLTVVSFVLEIRLLIRKSMSFLLIVRNIWANVKQWLVSIYLFINLFF